MTDTGKSVDIFLTGNGHWCAACWGTGKGREWLKVGKYSHILLPCPDCHGKGRKPGPGPNGPRPATTNYDQDFARTGAKRDEGDRQ